jgi:hypothetical protein
MSYLLAFLMAGLAFKLFAGPVCAFPIGSAEQRVKRDLEQLHRCMQRYYSREAEVPRSWAELKEPSAGIELDFTEDDPWGNPYIAQLGFTGTQMRVGTLGCDGELGGSKDDSDHWFDFELGSWGFRYSGSNSVRE